jgi:TolB-like protein
MEEAEIPLEYLHERVHQSAEHSGEKWISWVALSTAILAVLAAISALLSGKHANEAMMSQIEASDQWSYYQAKSIKAAVLDAKMFLAGTAGQNTAAAGPLLPEKSIAVLPFKNLSDRRVDTIAQGLQDRILGSLAETPGLKVISREWVMQYRDGVGQNSSEIGRQLGVAYLVEGSVRSAGNRIRVNAQLIDAQIDERVFVENYDRDLSDLGAIENDLVAKVRYQVKPGAGNNENSNGESLSSDREKASKYQEEETEIKSEAERKEAEAKSNFHKHEVYARAVTMFQIAIAIAAISALTQKRRFWTVSLIFGAVGCVFLLLGMITR